MKICPENGATSEGLSTIVQPAASAGNTLQAIWFSGQFQGVIIAHTPIGSRTTMVAPRGCSKAKFFSTSIAVTRWPSPVCTCGPAARAGGAPISSVTATARSAERFRYSASRAWSRSRRSSRVLCDHDPNAARAAVTAASTSA